MRENTVQESYCLNGQSVEGTSGFLSSIVDPTDRKSVHLP
jgi:hypothetical protein